MEKNQKWNRKEKGKIIVFIVLGVVLFAATILLFPYFIRLSDEVSRRQLIDYIRSKGFWGILVVLGLQLLQVVVAVIPGEVVEVAAGIVYGTFGGYLLCTFGVILSSSLVFYTVRRLGYDFVRKMIGEEKLHKLSFLQDAKRLEMLVFILFFIPGIPQDLLTYFVPLTDIKPVKFLAISTLARIPSILSSTYAGSTIDKGDFKMAALVFAITGVLGILGILFNDKIMNLLHRKKNEDHLKEGKK